MSAGRKVRPSADGTNRITVEANPTKGRDMAEHDLNAVAFPKLNEAQLAARGKPMPATPRA